MANPGSIPASTGRHYGMDWLRIGAFGLLIFYHVGMYFVPWDWHVKTAYPSDRAAILMLATNSWRLPLLFLVSGFASAALLLKDGRPGPFFRSRSSRLLIPLAFSIIVVVPPQPWIELVFKYGYSHGFWHFLTNDYFRFGVLDGIVLPTWQHLWFVAYLWVYTVALLALVMLPQNVRNGAALVAERLLSGPAVLAVPIGLIAFKNFVMFPGFDETHALVDDWGTHAVYFPIFLFGVLLFGSATLWAAIRRWWKLAAVLAIAAYSCVATLEYLYPGNTPLPAELKSVFELARIVHGWSSIVALVGLADRYLNVDTRWRATLTEAVFPFYIIHQTIIVVVGWWLLPAGMGNLSAFVILVAVTAIGCWIFYWAGRDIPGLRVAIGLRGKAPQARGLAR